MKIEYYTRVPLDSEGNFLYIKNEYLGTLEVNIEFPENKILNKRTGESATSMAFYQQNFDENGNELETPDLGDLDDWVVVEKIGETLQETPVRDFLFYKEK